MYYINIVDISIPITLLKTLKNRIIIECEKTRNTEIFEYLRQFLNYQYEEFIYRIIFNMNFCKF